MLPGFADGQWWVQDAAAALAGATVRRHQRQDHRRSLRRAGRQDRAAAPGRRTRHGGRPLAERAWRGCATIWRGCRSQAETVVADAAEWPAAADGRSTACWSTRPAPRPAPSGGIPTSPWLRQEADIGALTALQQRLLQKAAALLKPGGTLVYCTCSLEPEEGEQAIAPCWPRTGHAPRCRSTLAKSAARRDRHRGGRSAHFAEPSAPRRSCGSAGSTASTRRG